MIPAVRPGVRADLGRLIDAVVALNRNGEAADPRYRTRDDLPDRLRPVLSDQWFDRFLPFPAVWLAEDPADGSIAGMVSGEVLPDHPILGYPPTARIDNLWVAPAFRRAGLGRTLVASWRQAATSAGYARHVVSTLARDARAVAFWRAVGFEDMSVILAGS